MEKVTFEQYQEYGGNCSASDFPLFYEDAISCIRRFTNGKIDNAEISADIVRLIVRIIDEILSKNEFDARISSYSDGIESISYNSEAINDAGKDNRIYHLCLTYLPKSMTYRGVKEW